MEQTTRWTLPLLLGLCASGATTHAGMDAWGESKNRLGLNGHALFNIKASFSQLGASPPATDIGPASSGSNHDYDDGYNRVDGWNNAQGRTYYWGYDRSSQAQGEMIAMSSTSAQGGGSLDDLSDDPHWGGELTYMRELGYNNSYWYGLVVGLGWQDIHFSQNASFTHAATRVTDLYPLFGELPAAGYAGSVDSIDGPQLGDAPSRSATTVPHGAVTQGDYDFEASAYTLRAGLLFETPFNDWLDLQFGGGVTGVLVDGTFTVKETTAVSDLAPYTARAEDSSTSFVGGGYAELNLSLRLSRGIYAFAGARYLILTDVNQTAADRKVDLHLRNGIAAGVGVNFAF